MAHLDVWATLRWLLNNIPKTKRARAIVESLLPLQVAPMRNEPLDPTHYFPPENAELLDETGIIQAAGAVLESQLMRLPYLPRLPLFTPLWDMLLFITSRSRRSGGARVSATARDLGLPLSEAKAWLNVLTSEKLVVLNEDESDPVLSLTPTATHAVALYLTDLAAGRVWTTPE